MMPALSQRKVTDDPPKPSMWEEPTSAEDVANAYLLFLGRSAESAQVAQANAGVPLAQIVRMLLASEEFAAEVAAPLLERRLIGRGRFAAADWPALVEWAEKTLPLGAEETGAAILEYDDKKLTLPEHLRTTLDAICAKSSFRPEELPTRLNDEKKLAFIRYLNEQGFLKPVRSQ